MLWDALPDALLLARIQFAFNVTFHFLFPAFTIGLASYLAVLEGLWLWTKRELYLDLFRYWLKVFAVNFAMGVVSGIVLSYQFGTNWAAWSDRVGRGSESAVFGLHGARNPPAREGRIFNTKVVQCGRRSAS